MLWNLLFPVCWRTNFSSCSRLVLDSRRLEERRLTLQLACSSWMEMLHALSSCSAQQSAGWSWVRRREKGASQIVPKMEPYIDNDSRSSFKWEVAGGREICSQRRSHTFLASFRRSPTLADASASAAQEEHIVEVPPAKLKAR